MSDAVELTEEYLRRKSEAMSNIQVNKKVFWVGRSEEDNKIYNSRIPPRPLNQMFGKDGMWKPPEGFVIKNKKDPYQI